MQGAAEGATESAEPSPPGLITPAFTALEGVAVEHGLCDQRRLVKRLWFHRLVVRHSFPPYCLSIASSP
jgi:hypothetical protein